MAREDYNRTARLEEFLPWFTDWKFDWLDVPGLIRNCPHAYEYPLVDRDPIPQWTFGLTTLMGDAGIQCIRSFQRRLAGDPRRRVITAKSWRMARPMPLWWRMRRSGGRPRRILSCSTGATGRSR